MINRKTYLSEYWVNYKRKDFTADNMSTEIKIAATILDYPYLKGIPVEIMNTNFLRSG